MKFSKEHIIEEIKRTAEENGGKPLGTGVFYKKTGIRSNDCIGKYWARWSDALVEAGYEPNKLQERYADEYIAEQLIALIREYNRWPVKAEFLIKARKQKGFPSYTVFSERGNKAELASQVLRYCQGRSDVKDVVKICEPIAQSLPNQKTSSTKQIREDIGYVYLMKSGRHYKIGRTTSVGMREYQLKILLPERLTKVYVIKTDDPVGIEAYWHNRFKEKWKNGEWFELTSDDVKAFKRRAFM